MALLGHERLFSAKSEDAWSVGGVPVGTLVDMLALASDSRSGAAVVDVEIVVPVFNEERGLAAGIEKLHRYLQSSFPYRWLITIADNASTDATLQVALNSAASLDGVRVAHLAQKGRGRALRETWMNSRATVVAYMDVDLSTSLDGFLPLVAPLLSGHSDLAIGSRLAKGAQVSRGPRRELISRIYNGLLHWTMGATFSDAQCGFKAIRTDVARELLPLTRDNEWFFDSELLLLAEHNGLRIHEVPVDWIDDPDSRVHVVSTATADLRGMASTGWRLLRGEGSIERPLRATAPIWRWEDQLVRFAGIGMVSTVLASALFALLRPQLGLLPAYVASYVVCAIWGVAAHRRYTFAVRGRAGRQRHWLAGAAVSLGSLVVSTGALALAARSSDLSTMRALVVVTAVNLVMTAVRFLALRALFRPRNGASGGAGVRP